MRRPSAGAQYFAGHPSMHCNSTCNKGIYRRLRNSALFGTSSTGQRCMLALP